VNVARPSATAYAPIPRIAALRALDPEAWVREVFEAVRDADGRLDGAAEKLGISKSTLQRWIRFDERLADVRRLIPGRGRPRKSA
jgi:hypothetical protein